MEAKLDYETLLSKLLKYEEELKKITHKKNVIRKAIAEQMEEDNLSEVVRGEHKMLYIPPTTTNKFDTTAFKKKNEELYKKYLIQEERRGYVMLTKIKNKTDK